ncbi:hypothetical protein ACK1QP_004751 [Salmonella enterica]|nr:hypothetical protein [Salmonella enterica subsp. enterica]
MRLINEVKDKPVITTRQIMMESVLITHVFYDEDRDWQFFDASDFFESNAMVVSVQQIINKDNSLMDLPEMFPGDRIRRNSKEDIWEKF